jgi:uncharacterized protein (TIGR00730 family)
MINHRHPSSAYEINQIEKEDSWRLFRIIGEFVDGFETMSGVEPAVSFYGSARHLTRRNRIYRETEELAYRLGKMGFSVISGGGPGVMEAANRGAIRAGTQSIGLNISLPREQRSNLYTTRSLTFHHFFVRKVMLVKYTSAFIFMPGGLGTLDEMSEVLTLMQTQTIKPFPVLLYNRRYWQGFLEWLKNTVLEQGFISEEDLALLRLCDTLDQVTDAVRQWHDEHRLVGERAVSLHRRKDNTTSKQQVARG